MENLIHHVSEVLYVGLCGIIGTPTQVKIRRDMMDIDEMIRKPVEINKGFRSMLSGSCREGFRFMTSDRDMMIWTINDFVICDLSQFPLYHLEKTVILLECHDTAPGFAKLQLLTQTFNPFIKQSSVTVNDQVYISSSLHREKKQQTATMCIPQLKFSELHGPCTSGYFGGIFECDLAFCFSCQYWPPSASEWIERCHQQGWPSPQVLQDIISDGCHLVAISSRRKISVEQCETEWRVSFSLAEYKLVSSMNHTQFLCYGLMKIFLKEALNSGKDDPLLCSYFLKTTLFWKIQGRKISHWCPQNILNCVWMCFKLLIQCIYRGQLPNFFIPQNNMFVNKIHGTAQKQLFLMLLNLYNMGFSCLLQSQTLYQILINAVLNPWLQVSTDEKNMISEVDLDTEIFKDYIFIQYRDKSNLDKEDCLQIIRNIDNLFLRCSFFSEVQTTGLHIFKISTLICMAFMEKTGEDTNYLIPLDMLISATECGFISDRLYVAMYLYNKNRYKDALYYTEQTKQKLSQPYVWDLTNMSENKERYIEAVQGMSLSDKVRKAVSAFIILNQIHTIDEVKLELRASAYGSLFVPPLGMTHMLSFLCHHHLGDRLRSRQSLNDLQTLIYYDAGQLVGTLNGEILWQILGICEQIYGELDKALQSYCQSLRQFPMFQIQSASYARIENITKLKNYETMRQDVFVKHKCPR